MIRQGNTTQGRAVLESLAMKRKEKKKEKRRGKGRRKDRERGRGQVIKAIAMYFSPASQSHTE